VTGTYISLHHSLSLSSQHFDGLEHIHNSLIPHSLQDNAEGDEYTSTANTSTGRGDQILSTGYLYIYIKAILGWLCWL